MIGKFFAHREICSNLTITERKRQNNSRICRRAKLASNLQMNQREDIPAAQPCSVSQPEQQPPAQPDDEIEWTNVMNELDAIFLDPVVAPMQYNRTELLRVTRYEEDGATCQLCRLQKDQSTRTLLSAPFVTVYSRKQTNAPFICATAPPCHMICGLHE